MKIKIPILSLTFVVAICSSVMLARSRSDAEFLKQYAVDPDIAEILDNHHEEISHVVKKAYESGRTQHTTWNFPWLPDYFIKLNIERIDGMEKMRQCIEAFNLDLLMVPDKRMYHLKGRSTQLTSRNYVVVVKKIATDPHRQPMTLRHVEQLLTLMKKTEYISVTSSNYIRTYNGKIAMIDTESNFDIRKLLSGGFIRLISSGHDLSKDYTEEALKYILAQMAIELNKARGSEYNSVLSEIKRYLKRANRSHWDYLSFFEKELAKGANKYRAVIIQKAAHSI